MAADKRFIVLQESGCHYVLDCCFLLLAYVVKEMFRVIINHFEEDFPLYICDAWHEKCSSFGLYKLTDIRIVPFFLYNLISPVSVQPSDLDAEFTSAISTELHLFRKAEGHCSRSQIVDFCRNLRYLLANVARAVVNEGRLKACKGNSRLADGI